MGIHRKKPSDDPKSKPSPKTTSHNPNPNNNRRPRSDPNTHFGLLSFPFRDPPPLPLYGFHKLERRTIVLPDGSVRSYFAIPHDYQDFPSFTLPRPEFRGTGPGFQDHWGGDKAMKRYRGGEEEMIRPSKYMRTGGVEGGAGASRIKHNEVDQSALKKSFLLMVKLIYDDATLKRRYLAEGKQGRLQCLACNRTSKECPDMHSLSMHAYNLDNTDSLVEHLAFHKVLCVLMGWNYLTPPGHSKSYQMLSADEAAANRDDLILWPPLVIIHNTITGKRDDGRMEGLGNKAMDSYLRDGHLGVTLVKFACDQSGLMEAMRLAEYFEKYNHRRNAWAGLQPLTQGKDDENNPDLFKFDHRTGEKKRVFYGYLVTVNDLEKVDFDFRKKITIASRSDYKPSG
ncbi:unnamed protein product [Withania somnifera]